MIPEANASSDDVKGAEIRIPSRVGAAQRIGQVWCVELGCRPLCRRPRDRVVVLRFAAVVSRIRVSARSVGGVQGTRNRRTAPRTRDLSREGATSGNNGG